MTDHQSFIGGARVGLWNATWPFAKLTVTPDQLHLRVLGAGTFEFPAGTVTVTSYIQIPVIGWGVRISHEILPYPKKIIFWTFRPPGSVIKRITETGFPVGPVDIKKGYPIAASLYYRCKLCGNVLPSQPDRGQCRCGNLSIDVAFPQVSARDESQIELLRVINLK